MPIKFKPDQELDYTANDICNALLDGVIKLLDEIETIDPKDLNTYVDAIIQLLNLEKEVEEKNQEDDPDEDDLKDLSEKLKNYKIVKMDFNDGVSKPFKSITKILKDEKE